MSSENISHNMGLDLVRATEAAAISAGRWLGRGRPNDADAEATAAMAEELDSLDIDGAIVIGEEGRADKSADLRSGRHIGTGRGPAVDVVVDPIDGRRMLAQGRSGAIAVAAVAPRDTMWQPSPAVYMDKIVVNRQVGDALVPECLDAPAAWTLALVARAKDKRVRDLVVFVLDRPRHADLIEEIRSAGARVMLRGDGDISGALMAASVNGVVDIMMGVGGAPEGVIAACAVNALGGAMLARLSPQTSAEQSAIADAGLDPQRVLVASELVTSNKVFFTATGISDGPLLRGIRYQGDRAETQSLVLRCETGTRRTIWAEHLVDDQEQQP